ncbi:Protein kinase C delta type [Lamellibrachia satsuma]|nr:Protein kinase C delta type [Lamellibrachia satsuma]
MNGVSSKRTLRVKVVGCDGMGELDLIKDMYMSVVIKEVTMSPDGSNVSFVKKKSFLPEWNSTFEADVDSDPLIQLTLRQWSRSVLADLNVSSRMLADKCVNDSVMPISLELKPKGSLRVELQHVTKPKEKPKEAGRKVAVIKRKVAGHTLHPCYSRLGNTCAVCSDKIWGLTKKAFRCKACSLICHKKCVEGLQNTCSGTKKKHGVTPAPNWEWARVIVDIAGAPSTATSQTPQTPSKPTTSCTLDNFVLLKVIGKGAFGKVMLAELRDSGQYFAIKALKKDVVLEDDNLNCTIVERRVLQIGGQHPHLTHLHATFQSKV